ncbi:MAG: hypothetical protein HXK57_04855 [Campylobacter concisus]|nr:hypothetical protein [Campylobacter concisus]
MVTKFGREFWLVLMKFVKFHFCLPSPTQPLAKKQKPFFKVKFSLAIWLNLAISAYLWLKFSKF